MLDHLKKTVKHTAIYSLGNISTKLVGLVLLPLYTSHLSTTEYGILSIIEITSQVLVGFFVLYLPQAMLRWCATEQDIEEEKSIIFTTLVSLLVISALLVGSLLPLNQELSLLIFGSDKFSNYFILLLIWSFVSIINRLPNSLIRLRERSVFFSFMMVTKFVIILLTNIYFVAYADMGVEGIVWGQIIGEIYSLVISIPIIVRNLSYTFNYKVVVSMLRYGFPLSFAAVSSLLLASGDRYILTYFLSFSSVGVYAVGQKIGGIINAFFLQSFQQGFMPIAFKMLNEDAPTRFYSKVLTYFTLLLSFAALSLSLFSEEILNVFTEPEYYGAYLVIPLIAFAHVVRSIDFVFSLGFHYAKKTSVYAVIIICGMFLTIGLNFLLIPIFDIYGAGLAMIISYSIMATATYFMSQRVYRINYEIKKVFMILITALFLYLTVFLISDFSSTLKVIIKFVLLIIFPFILYRFKFFEEIELLRLKQSWQKWKYPSKWKDNFNKIKF